MSNFSLFAMGVAMVVMVMQVYKMHNLNYDLRKQMVKFEAMKQSLREDVLFCEQRTKNCQNDLENEVAWKGDVLKKLKAEKRQAGIMSTKLDLAMTKMAEEKNDILKKNEAHEKQLKEVLAQVDAITKERNSAKEDASKYNNLYVETNKLLETMRRDCQAKGIQMNKQSRARRRMSTTVSAAETTEDTTVMKQSTAAYRDERRRDSTSSKVTGKLPLPLQKRAQREARDEEMQRESRKKMGRAPRTEGGGGREEEGKREKR